MACKRPDEIHIDVLDLGGKLVASLSLDSTRTVPHLRRTVAEKIGVAPKQVHLQHGDTSITDGHGKTLIEVFGLAENCTVTATQLVPREFVAEFFLANTGYDEGFINEVKVSAGTRADFDRLLDEARAGVQPAVGLDHYFVPMVDMDGQRVLTPTETDGKYVVAKRSPGPIFNPAKRIGFRLNASFDDENNVVTGAEERGLPCEGDTLLGKEVADGWLQVSVHATKIRCDKCNGDGIDRYGVHGPEGQTCTECLGTGFQKEGKFMQAVTVGLVEEMEVTAQDVLDHWSYTLAMEKGPIPGRPQMLGQDALQLLRDATSNVLQFKYQDQRTKPVLREGFGIQARSGRYETVFVGDHIFEMFECCET